MSNNLSGPSVATRLERHSAIASGTALHPGKNLAVSPELNRFVTVRISFARKKQMTGVTCYLFNLGLPRVSVRTFLPYIPCGTSGLLLSALPLVCHKNSLFKSDYLPFGNPLRGGKSCRHFQYVLHRRRRIEYLRRV